MSEEFSDTNLKNAFFKTLAHTGFGAFESGGDQYMPEKVLVTIPAEMQSNFPQKLLQSAIFICINVPFLWQVDDKIPVINDNTIFNDLFNNWFKHILS